MTDEPSLVLPLYQVHWRYRNREGHSRVGSPMLMTTAQATATAFNEQWPDLVHWIEPVKDSTDA